MRGYTDLRKSPVLRRMRGYIGYTESASVLIRLLPILLEEMVAWGCRNGKFNEQIQTLQLKLKVKLI